MCSIWGNANQLTINKVRVLQNGALKNVLKVERLYPTKMIYENTRIMPLDALIQANLALTIYKHRIQSKTINTRIILNSNVHNYQTKGGTKSKNNTFSKTKKDTSGHANNKLKSPLKIKYIIEVERRSSGVAENLE